MSDPKSNDCDDVEITPEMIEAGVSALLNHDSRFEVDYDDTIAEIFEAMWAARVKA